LVSFLFFYRRAAQEWSSINPKHDLEAVLATVTSIVGNNNADAVEQQKKTLSQSSMPMSGC
jgi:hypothetical protein